MTDKTTEQQLADALDKVETLEADMKPLYQAVSFLMQVQSAKGKAVTQHKEFTESIKGYNPPAMSDSGVKLLNLILAIAEGQKK